jgi:prophage regulatory protein
MTERLLKKAEVEQITSLSATEIQRREKDGTFPLHLSISPKRVAWIASEIEAWVQAKIKNARSNA